MTIQPEGAASDRPPVRAYLWVQSSRLTPEELRARLGCGEARRHPRLGVASWTLPLTWADAVHGGTEGISRALADVDEALTAALLALPRDSHEIGLNIVQDLTLPGDAWFQGIHLDQDALRWLGTVGAAIDVDQYVYAGECECTAPGDGRGAARGDDPPII